MHLRFVSFERIQKENEVSGTPKVLSLSLPTPEFFCCEGDEEREEKKRGEERKEKRATGATKWNRARVSYNTTKW